MSCQIFIDTPSPFYSGSLIQGKLVCTFNGSQKIRGIKIRAYGDEHTEWWGTESYYNHSENRHETRSVMYTGDNNLFGWESMLFGGHSGDTHVGPGRFTYPFSFQLPSNLPSTFENSYGYIRYTLKGIVDIPWGMDYEDTLQFVVLSLIDLNTFPLESFQPVSRSDEKTVCCWCCAGGEITVDINISKTAFVPGENIKLFVSMTNMSNSNVEGLEAKLIQYIRSQVHTPSNETKSEENTLAQDSWSGVGAHGENKYDIELPIPTEVAIPNLDRSSLFEVSYDVEISASISGCHSDIDLSFSVTIGHIQNQSQMGGAPMPGGFSPPPNYPPQDGNAYPYPNNEGASGYPYSPGGGTGYPGASYPNIAGGAYPPAPQGGYPPNPAAPFPPAGPGFVAPGPAASAPMAPTPYSSGPPNYASVSSEKPTWPGGPPSAPTSAAQAKEREALGEGGAPSAPPSNLPPPTYEDSLRKN
ncbi:hypothetical protein HHI36_009144 [Cryptolaemus montrouzieri]|uniref:Arrestin C-terminal-like domain-containing protein n=1 Tax=Cryptolaemus montrouzieri TaxID=559131 RepID=A0ABD2MVC1_9CUCU